MSEKKVYVSSSRFDIVYALDKICTKYHIKQSDIRLFLPIYYPIAIIKMSMRERTFEDIENIPYIILKLISHGISKTSEISEITGLPENYVHSIIKIMQNGCQINNLGELTDVGILSINEKKNIKLLKEEQCFQIDTLTGRLVKQKSFVSELYGLKETQKKGLYNQSYVMGMPGVDEEYIKNQIVNGNTEEYLENRGDILHTNVEYIDSVEYVETKYARAYLMTTVDRDNAPLIFSNRKDKKSSENVSRFSYQPYFVWDRTQLNEIGVSEEDVPVINDEYVKSSVHTVLNLANKEVERIRSSKKLLNIVENAIKILFPLEFKERDIEHSDDYLGVINIEPQMIKKCNGSLIHLMWLMSTNGAAYISNEDTYGGVIKISTKNENIYKLVFLYAKALGVKKRQEIKSDIMNKFGSYDGQNIVEELSEFLKNYQQD